MATKKAVKKTPAASDANNRALDVHRVAEEWILHPGSAAGDVDTLCEEYVRRIELLRAPIEAGNGDAMLDALEYVCFCGDPMPEWLSTALTDAIRKYKQMHVRTLDEAFQLVPREGFTKKAKRARYGLMIYFEVCALHHAGAPITQGLFQDVGEIHGVGRDVAMECYSTELKSRGNRRVSGKELPKRLWPAFFNATGKTYKNQL